MQWSVDRWTVAVGLGLAVSVLTACKSGSGHQENVQAANDRWMSMRASLVLPMAQRQFDTGDLDQAERTLAEAMTVDSQNPHLFVLAGRVALERGQLERSYQRFKSAIELNSDLSEAHYFQGVVLQRWRRYEAALESYQKAHEKTPDNAAYLVAHCEMLVTLNRADEALEQLEGKASYFDQNAGIRVALGQLYAMQNDYNSAVDYFQQASLLQPDDVGIQEELAMAQLANGEADLAALNLEQLCAKTSIAKRPDLRRGLAKAYLATGRFADARSLYLLLTRQDPKDVDAWTHLGEIAWSNNDTASALVAANRVMSLSPDRYEGYLLAGMVWHRRGQLERALSMFDHAADRAPKDAMPMILRGITLEQAQRPEEAAEAYAEALRRQPQDEHAQSLLEQVAQVETQ